MANNNPSDVIEAYRRRQERRFPFTLADLSKGLLLLFMLASSAYVIATGGPELPTLVELKTNTPTFTPSITPAPTETSDPELQCNCPSLEILVVTATFSDTVTALPVPTETATTAFTPIAAFPPSDTPLPTNTPTSTPSATPPPTPRLYTVQRGDTLSGIALRFGVSVEAIQQLNGLGDSTIIVLGQILQIPPRP